ncbi:MAG: InlB B-repeat-containing protein [Oscillospiraceae bacterium]|nr:InlB B-repeat-containing protein [Oscillospiraceae bacterium]
MRRRRSVLCLMLVLAMAASFVLSSGIALAANSKAVVSSETQTAKQSDDASTGDKPYKGFTPKGNKETHLASPTGPVLVSVTSQPENRVVNYPDSTSFHVSVDHPENVASYRWELRDGDEEDVGWNIFVLEGSSALTDTLIIPSTERNPHTNYLRCIITDKNGNEIVSDEASLVIGNYEEIKPVLYVGEYAVEPGETLDLADTTMGSGTVVYDADGVNITFNDFRFNNSTLLYDQVLAPSFGLMLYDMTGSSQEYFMHFKGTCVIDNRFFKASENSGGIVINSHFGVSDSPEKPTLVIDGDGKLTLKGGMYSVYTDGELEIAANIRTEPMDKNYCAGLRAHSVLIDSGVTADITSYGSGIIALGDLRIFDGATVNIDSTVPHVSAGFPMMLMINAKGSVNIRNATVNLKGKGDPELIVPYNRVIANLTGISSDTGINIDGSKLKIDLTALPSDEFYTANFCGIAGNDFAGMALSNKASVAIDINYPDVIGVTGVILGGNLFVDKDCELKVSIDADGRVRGIVADGRLTVEDGIIDVSAATSSATEGEWGIICGNGASVNLTDSKNYVRSRTADGIAFISVSDREITDPVAFDPDYTPAVTQLKGRAELVSPANGRISCVGFSIEAKTYLAETVYDNGHTTAPACEMRIAAGDVVIVKHKVTFNTNGGSEVSSQNVENGKKASKPADPTKEGYTFDGWYRDEKLTEAYDFSTSVTADITLYAKWTEDTSIKYTVTDGADSSWKKGTSSGVTMTIKRSENDDECFDYFSSVEIDGKELKKGEDYTIKSRNNTVTLNASALEKLSTGKYTVTIKFDDGKAETTLTINAKGSSGGSGGGSSPGTHDLTEIAGWIALMAAGAACAAALIIFRKRHRAAEGK